VPFAAHFRLKVRDALGEGYAGSDHASLRADFAME